MAAEGVIFSLLFLSSAMSGFAQNAPVVIGAGYANPSVILVAPGQLVTVFVSGVKTLLPLQEDQVTRKVQAASVPLPFSLAGLSARVEQRENVFPAPIFTVTQVPICSNRDLGAVLPPASPECWITGLTVQIPFEIVRIPEDRSNPNHPNPIVTRLIITENQNDSTALTICPWQDNIHIVTTCDPYPNVLAGAPRQT
jgi:hypothetical protein